MFLVVGLGNPGEQYAETRHNAGFMVVDRLLRPLGLTTRRRFHGELADGRPTLDGLFLKPQTYMNESGLAVRETATFFRIPVSDVVVVHDDIDLAYGRIQVRRGGGDAGHKGVRSTARHLGDREFVRVRFGVGRPVHGTVEDYVLGRFGADERIVLDGLVDRAAEAVDVVLRDGLTAAADRFNRATVQT